MRKAAALRRREVRAAFGFWLVLWAALAACGLGGRYGHHRGAAFGTHVEVFYSGSCRGGPGQAVADALAQVDAEISTWRSDSVLARFNVGPVDQWMPVPGPLAALVDEALTLSRQSGGAFDVTVAPLVDLWGFGPTPAQAAPSPSAIEEARARVGHRHLQARLQPPALRKGLPGLAVDLSAIGKGHGVDRAAQSLQRLGCRDYLIDVGGEVRTLGRNPQGLPWRIGIESPGGGTLRTLALSGLAAATSGDYRNYRMEGGRRLSHALDPRTGRPVQGDLASVTVVAESAAEADALATAILVLGPQAGRRFARQRGIAALLLTRRQEGNAETFAETHTEPMRRHFLNGAL